MGSTGRLSNSGSPRRASSPWNQSPAALRFSRLGTRSLVTRMTLICGINLVVSIVLSLVVSSQMAGPPVLVSVIAVAPPGMKADSPAIANLINSAKEWSKAHTDPAPFSTPFSKRLTVEIVVVYPSNSLLDVNWSNEQPYGTPRIVLAQPCNPDLLQRGGGRAGCTSLVSYTDLANFGVTHARHDTTHFFFFSLTNDANSGLLPSLLHPMHDDPTIGIAGCTLVQRDEDALKLLEHGIVVGNGWVGNQWTPHLIRQYAGFIAVDKRVKQPADVVAVSPYCMLIGSEVWRKMGGMRKFTTSVQEQIALGQISKDFRQQQQLHLKKKVILLGTYSQRIPKKSNPSTRQRRIKQNAEHVFQDALKVAEQLEGKEIDIHEDIDLTEETATLESVAKDDYVKLSWLTNEMKILLLKINRFHKVTGVAGSQEEGGWDLCLRLKQRRFKVMSVPEYAEVIPERIPDIMLPLAGSGNSSSPSIRIDGVFGEVWGKQIRQYWPGAGTPSVMAQTQPGPIARIIWQSFCCHCCGFANEILHLVFPLQRKHAVHLIPAPDCFCEGYPSAVMDSLSRMHMPMSLMSAPTNTDEVVIWVSHTDPGSYFTPILQKKNPSYVVGRSMYEFTKIPQRWVNECRDNADEIWVPSNFVRDVWIENGVDAKKVILIPEAVDVYFFDPLVAGKLEFPLDPKLFKFFNSMENTPAQEQQQNFKFLSHFKWEDRKGWDVLFMSYFRAFGAEDKVTLIVLTHIWFPGPPETHGDATNHTYIREVVWDMALTRLGRAKETLPHFVLLTSRLTEEDVSALYNSVDAFVLPTRGEGWGLPPLQAMSMGIPTATTNWSGTVDFLDPEYSFPIPVESLSELPRDSVYGWTPGKMWANPSMADTISIMKYMANPANAQTLKRMGMKARSHVVAHYSEDAVAEIVSKRINTIKQLVVDNLVPPRKPRWWG